MAAYLEHAARLGQTDGDINEFILQTLGKLVTCNDANELTALVLKTGEWGVKAMALLDKANTTAYGNPEITEVNIGVGNRPGILISGHDLNDIEQLLEQSKDAGIDIYTHSEMLPAHYYPKLKKYSHLKGNYGNAWWKQREEFEAFNGPILFTTNCIVPPTANATYKDRVFTTNSTGFPGWKHIPADANGKKDFSEIIALAKTCQAPKEIETGKIIGGFAHEQVFALADKVVEAVKSGAIRKFVVMAGCDGRMKSREYYTEFAKALPKDCVILTAGCAKYKYNKLGLGDINGIPRVLDAGQCNDSYSLALIALKLKEVFGLDDVNQLPIAYNIAWYEQKAVIVLLALLSLGVKNIHLGPTLPAFLSPNVAKVLVENFGISLTISESTRLSEGLVAPSCSAAAATEVMLPLASRYSMTRLRRLLTAKVRIFRLRKRPRSERISRKARNTVGSCCINSKKASRLMCHTAQSVRAVTSTGTTLLLANRNAGASNIGAFRWSTSTSRPSSPIIRASA